MVVGEKTGVIVEGVVVPDLQHVLPVVPDLQQVFFDPSSAAVVGVAVFVVTSVLFVLTVLEVVVVAGAVAVVVVVVVVVVLTVFAGSLST